MHIRRIKNKEDSKVHLHIVHTRGDKKKRSFTLVELLIVIAILAVLAAAVVIVLNPAEMLAEARDSQRVSDLKSVNDSIRVFEVDNPSASLGSAQTVYLSVPDANSNCSGVSGLPTLPSGWAYRCVTNANLRKTDGTGWIPLNFGLVSGGSNLPYLPIDPSNDAATGRYYTYTPGGSYELTALLEADKHMASVNDGGSLPGVYQIGTHIDLTPALRDNGLAGYWTFDEGSGTTAYDRSGGSNNGTFVGTPVWQSGASCKRGGCLRFSSGNYVDIGNRPGLRTIGSQTIAMWIYPRALNDGQRRNPYNKAFGGEGTITQETNGSMSYYYGTNGGDGSPYQGFTSSFVLNANEWAHIVAVRNLSTMKVTWYINGDLALETDALYSSAKASGNSAQIGNGYAGPSYDGDMDDVRVYGRALSAQEIKAIYEATK